MNRLFKIFLFSFMLLFLTCNISFAKISRSPYRIVQDPTGVYIVEIIASRAKDRLVPYCVEGLETNLGVFNSTNARLVVNAGFFDPKNKKTVSYLISDSKVLLDPTKNENLTKNKALEPYLDKIFNRSEFRILKDSKGKIVYDIAAHNDKIQDGFTLKHSIQAGPLLLPELKLEEEFFVLVKDGKIISESASALHKYARTAIGIRNNNVYLFIVTNDAPMNLKELADLTRKWGMQKAMAFDGGGSTSFDSQELHIISEKDNQARKLKSFLILK